jgi:arabinofuranosyltransferase
MIPLVAPDLLAPPGPSPVRATAAALCAAGQRRIAPRPNPCAAASTWRRLTPLIVAVITVRLMACIPCALYDDAFITLRYAENLAAGQGFVYAPGAPWEPVLGTTTPGFTLVLAAARAIGLALPVFVVVLNALCDAALACLIAGALARRSVLRGVLAALTLAALPAAVRVSVGGMEAPLFVLCAWLTFAAASAGRPRRAALVGLATALLRPEGVLVLGIAGVIFARSKRRDLLIYLATGVPLGLMYLLAATAYFGSPIPHSVLAKAGEHGAAWTRLGDILRASFVPHTACWAALPLVIVGIGASLRRPGTLRAYVAWTLLLTAAYLAARPKMWGWYFYPVLTAFGIWLELGLSAVLSSVPRLRDRLAGLAATRRASWVGSLAGLAAWTAVALAAGPSPARTQVYEPLAAWAREAALPATTRIVAYDVGAVGYFTRARILDAAGLVWPAPLGARSVADLVREQQPDYLFLTVARDELTSIERDPEFAACYQPVQRFNVQGDLSLAAAANSVSRAWRQDYILYQRVPSAAGAVATAD